MYGDLEQSKVPALFEVTFEYKQVTKYCQAVVITMEEKPQSVKRIDSLGGGGALSFNSVWWGKPSLIRSDKVRLERAL